MNNILYLFLDYNSILSTYFLKLARFHVPFWLRHNFAYLFLLSSLAYVQAMTYVK